MTSLKLTKELIKSIVNKKVAECTKEEITAILKMFGFSVKEYTSRPPKEGYKVPSVNFEIHYKRNYIIEVSADGASAISYSNEWVNFGEGTDGLCMPTENTGTLILLMVNFFVPKLLPNYDGPEYNEHRDYEYESIEEVSSLFDCLKDELEVI